ncbi:Mating-C multi-domain protein [Pyrenophora tritici-repentis]|uniref:Tymo-45kd-70kd multi-domain protein n=2 Tax=Pyrenophora tritici-repentis TaxID=45151 RepID=A0A2W1HDG2_9PLEO|nr:uncharacterized protein PTRG_09007 [Pyrenophora tritici-repentis Pt-1C-BFP]KAA8627586.1 hypothetical protein PtrV1_03266 [Pyrenophora tritici-repentis]EDU42058.1 conserved hypothetical protein [Pyrenophora tritici-repentis Pt-1C-BFP]KAF7442383.1 hypothetical protein A1F99_132520 [Pyrenophora tritici-repentis]KAF7579245.1 Tymo-45kd-70kd multi-domain protein [Pyrenophora tritici-repentis]KAG9378173.1 hypothetical protein A1F94_011289 [Pyrenophora tritici-repentis]
MASPSYTRATTSSEYRSKATPKPSTTTPVKPLSSKLSLSAKTSKSSTPSSSKHTTTPKKPLKRPSLLTSQTKNHLAYTSDLYTITPKDAKKPCPLATLPSELRSLIYTFIFPTAIYVSNARSLQVQARPPALLHVCRAIRIEAAYTYYLHTCFTFTVRNLNFSPITRWLDSLPKQHKALVTRNRRLEINVLPCVKNTCTYPPPGFLIDGYLEDQWVSCQPFGNLYDLPSTLHKRHFLVFCRMAAWWMWCSRLGNKGVRWNYGFEQSTWQNAFAVPDARDAAVLEDFLGECGMVVAMPCVEKAWRRNRGAARGMRDEAIRWFEALDGWYNERYGKEEDGEWDSKMEVVRESIKRW